MGKISPLFSKGGSPLSPLGEGIPAPLRNELQKRPALQERPATPAPRRPTPRDLERMARNA